MVLRQPGVLVDAHDLAHDPTGHAVAGIRRPVGERRHLAGQLAVAVGLRQFPVGKADALLPGLHRAVAQHQMGEIDVEFVWRHVGALHHEAHVAQRARIDDIRKALAVHTVKLAGFRLVDQVEQARKTVTQVEAAPAAVAHIRLAPEFLIQLRFVVKIRVLPIQRMTERGAGVFFHGSSPSSSCRPDPTLSGARHTLTAAA